MVVVQTTFFIIRNYERTISYEEVWFLDRALRAFLPTGHPDGLDFEALSIYSYEKDFFCVVTEI